MLSPVGGPGFCPAPTLRLSSPSATLPSEDLGEFMEMKGANSPGILVLTTGLSKPFMRLDKYPTLLKELERHMEVGPGSPWVTCSGQTRGGPVSLWVTCGGQTRGRP